MPESAAKSSRSQRHRLPSLSQRLASTQTTTLPALTVDGSDAIFRQFMHDFLSLMKYIEAGRGEFARAMNVTSAQYSIIMAVASHHEKGGITIGNIASTLHVRSPFVVLNAGTLVSKGILRREPKPDDARSVLLYLTDKGKKLIEKVNPLVLLANDTLFKSLSAADFRRLAQIFSVLASDVVMTHRAVRLMRQSMEATDAKAAKNRTSLATR